METIIVQDTDQNVLEMLIIALELGNFKVYPLIDFDDDFMGMIDKYRPHVVMMDYTWHGERCLEVCRSIKAKYPHLPVIASSCNNNIHQEYSRLGFDGYIKKPFDLDLLYRILREHIPKPAPNRARLIFPR
ncbi:response regulator [Mucilaginibacter sp. BT774]|uniref:response regulator n=1 Tax=Mucilaginibacter sp. BT774 TaxID=3062276 RepID=UPI002675FFE9|nr:response regulator [Mucilaginibacter sp. BT774]MDO3627634.1 response regulator [Mucilaginibacter sp. BT774]